MLSGDTETSSRIGPAGPAALLLILVTLTMVVGDRISELESNFYDFLQRQQSLPASDQVILVSTDTTVSGDDLWNAERFQSLVNALNTAGAKSILPVEAPPANSQLPDFQRLTALVELQQRSRQSGDADQTLSRQLETFRRQYEQQAEMEALVNKAGNVILPLPGEDGRVTADECASHAIPLRSEDALALLDGVRTVPSTSDLSASICAAAAAAGIGQYWPDPDRIVRRTNLIVNSGGLLYPALAVAGLLPADDQANVSIADRGRLIVNGAQIDTGPGFTSLNRFYAAQPGEQPFRTVSASELLAGKVPAEAIRGRIAVLGNLAVDERSAYRTPVARNVPAATLLATSLSNLLEMDFVLRPDWFRWAELMLVLALGAAILIAVPTMSGNGASLAALLLGALLLTTEAWLFMSQGIWVQMVKPTVFTVLGIGCLQAIRGLFRVATPAGASHMAHAAAAAGLDELDLAFSMLRQQPASDETKEKLYKLAITHGKSKEYAKAERVLRHLASLDPDYRNVSEKLRKLSGSRLRNGDPGSEQAAKQDSVPMPKVPRASGPRRTLGRYELDRVLGRGAMATVYLGRDPNINRQVAIKTIALSEEFSEEDLESAKQQFMREAESAGRLNHPNIITIYDVGEDDGVAYLAMEYFEGKALSEHAQASTLLPPDWVLELSARAAEALHYAHEQKVVHRDIKPANLMYNAAMDSLKITDFGIARLTDTSRTKTGIILGTPSYMSPEQLSAAPVTGRSDLYSLGITMHQLLTGYAPFRADSIPKLMDKIMNERHQPLSSIRDDLPASIDEVLDKALAKDPDDRFPNGRAMALALRDCCSSLK